jgi:hypothetical protein
MYDRINFNSIQAGDYPACMSFADAFLTGEDVNLIPLEGVVVPAVRQPDVTRTDQAYLPQVKVRPEVHPILQRQLSVSLRFHRCEHRTVFQPPIVDDSVLGDSTFYDDIFDLRAATGQ